MISPDATEDLDVNGKVNSLDLGVIIAYWSSVSPTPTPPPIVSCLSQPGPLVTKSGVQSSKYDARGSNALAADTKIDARQASWIANWPVQDSFNYPVVLEGGSGVCFFGGEITGNYPDQIGNDANTTWSYMHSTTGIEIGLPNFTIEGVRVHNYGDGISIRDNETSGFTVKNVYFSDIRDDCIENDYLRKGLVDDSLFDGCYSAFSSRSECSSCDGSNKVWTIQNSLIRLKATMGVYKNRGIIPGHDGFFKWGNDGGAQPNKSPQLALHNNIFRVDQDANNVGLGIPADNKLVSCSNNIMVWLGSGSYPDPLPEDCFTITTDVSVWDNAKTDWLSRHGY